MKYVTRTAFSLVELSIVLVILGLLTGGILAGQSLIRAAELRSVSSEYGRYLSAEQAFRDKYFAIPGDMANATAFWGYSGGTECVNRTGTASTSPGTCDGNADNYLGLNTVVTDTYSSAEVFQFWRQLALAGMIEGNYNGTTGALTVWCWTYGPPSCGSGGLDGLQIVGVNAPPSHLANAIWGVGITYRGNYTGSAYTYAINYGNFFTLGNSSDSNISPMLPVLKPEEAWNIDTKLDDGMPGTGKVIARYWNNACATASSNTDLTGLYKVSATTLQCSLYFVRSF